MVADPARLLPQGHRADVQLLDVVDGADGQLALLGQRQAEKGEHTAHKGQNASMTGL